MFMVISTSRAGWTNEFDAPGMARILRSEYIPLEPIQPDTFDLNSTHGVIMKTVIQPLAWFLVLTSILAVASGLSLAVVNDATIPTGLVISKG
jgi:hypothetical protein